LTPLPEVPGISSRLLAHSIEPGTKHQFESGHPDSARRRSDLSERWRAVRLHKKRTIAAKAVIDRRLRPPKGGVFQRPKAGALIHQNEG